MFKSGHLIGDILAVIGMALAISGIGLLPIQYLVWLKTGVWVEAAPFGGGVHDRRAVMHIRTVFDLVSVAT